MSFLDGKPRIATERECKACWGGGGPGEFFRCRLCGYKFKVGDYWRCVYTNDDSSAPGNPLICEGCDGPDVKEKWRALHEEYYSDKFWWFRK